MHFVNPSRRWKTLILNKFFKKYLDFTFVFLYFAQEFRNESQMNASLILVLSLIVLVP